ncbi:MAG: threonine/serine dehydratase [Gemmatimonadales bacterium]
MTDRLLVTTADIAAAHEVIDRRVRRTPMMHSVQLSDRLGFTLHLKLENFQKTGSFKVRGALNRIAGLTADERRRGVVTMSAGNHGQGVAFAAREMGTRATIVMPSTAVKSKVEATKNYGGEVVQTDADLVGTMQAIQAKRNLVAVSPFDDPAIIAGAGTVGDEILDDMPQVDVILVGVGGGGILSGLGVAARARRPEIRVIGVEPEGANTMRLSVDRGSAQKIAKAVTVADGLAAPMAGELTYAHVRQLALEIVTVPDRAIIDAMWTIIERCKVLAEPAAAAGLAALLTGAITIEPGTSVVCVVTGGNADREKLRALA